MGLGLKDPLVVATSANMWLIADRDFATNLRANAQTWSAADGYSEAKPLQVWLKFLYYLEEVNPPYPWVEPK